MTSFDLQIEGLGPLPIVNHFIARLELDRILSSFVPAQDRGTGMPYAKGLGVLLRSIIVEREPIYRQEELARAFAPGQFGVGAREVGLLSDDHVGRALDRLFDADRAALMTEVAVRMAQRFEVRLDELHNDSTTVRLTGQYARAKGRSIRGKRAPWITHGNSKDHRPDLKQLLFMMTVSADGGVPLQFRCGDGNASDSLTHIETWEALRKIAGRLYALRCKAQALSSNTLALYAFAFQALRRYLTDNGAPAPCEVQAQHLRGFLESLRGKLASETVDARYRQVKTFFGFLRSDGLLYKDPMEAVERPKCELRLVRPFTVEELRAVLAQVPTKSALGLRDRALILMLADSGLRVSEALSLTLASLVMATNSAVVLGKGGKERRVPWGEATRRALMAWLRGRPDAKDSDPVFCNRYGTPMERHHVAHRLKGYTRKAGIAERGLGLHRLRHLCAVSLQVPWRSPRGPTGTPRLPARLPSDRRRGSLGFRHGLLCPASMGVATSGPGHQCRHRRTATLEMAVAAGVSGRAARSRCGVAASRAGP